MGERKKGELNVTETKLSFGLEDIRAIRFVCRVCGNEVGWNVEGKSSLLPYQCPWRGCDNNWYSNPANQEAMQRVGAFFDFVRQVAEEQHMLITVQLDVSLPKNSN